MIAFDLDGTLLNSEKELTDRTKQVLKEAAREGIYVLPATGRPLRGLPEELMNLPEIRYAVTANGARIMENGKEEPIFKKLIPEEYLHKIVNIFEEYDVLCDVYYDGVGYSEKEKLACIREYAPSEAVAKYILRTRMPVQNIHEKIDVEHRPADKLQALFRHREDKWKAWERIKALGCVEVTGALENNVELNALGVDKGTALLKLGEMLGIAKEEIMAFGDGANDIKMLQTVGTGVAMANAMSVLKEVADAHTLSNDEDGVAYYIEENVLR